MSYSLFCLFYTNTIITVEVFFLNVVRSRNIFSGCRANVKLPRPWIALDNETKNNNRRSRRQIVPRRCAVFFLLNAILECEFAWWEIKSKFLQAHWSYRGAIVQVCGPWSKAGCLVGPACSQCCLCAAIRNNSHWRATAREFTAAVKSQGLLTGALRSTSHWPLRCPNILHLHNYGHLRTCSSLYYHCQELQGVSTVSALWFISRCTGMHRWLALWSNCHVVADDRMSSVILSAPGA